MNTPANTGITALTEKEKQTLRLIVRGHDAKSIARSLDLSVHTINERLRDARRKMTVSSSREAARLLLQAEGESAVPPSPHLLGHAKMGEDDADHLVDHEAAPIEGVARAYPRPSILMGVTVMTFALGLFALIALPQADTAVAPTPATEQETPIPEVVDSARRWLMLVDQARWEDSYRATGLAFRKLNTAKVWASVSEKVRVPLGAVMSRTFLSQQNLPAPPASYEVVKFRTSFANKANTTETVTLEREDGGWRIVGVTIG